MPPDDGAESLPELAAAAAALDDAVLGGPRELTLAEVADRFAVSQEDVRDYWYALGLALPDPQARAFTAADGAMIAAIVRAGDQYGLRREAGVSLVRAMGYSAERLVAWQTETIVEHLGAKYGLSDALARRLLLARLVDVHEVFERGLVHAWNRHLSATGRRIADSPDVVPDDEDELPLARAVGMADVVGFTARTADLGAAALADYVQSFESRARHAVARHGGRVIKTVGDALLFIADDPVTGARVARALVDELGPDSDAPLRVGLVWGRVLARFGDVFGPAVALASRLCDAAEPGAVLVDEVTAADLVHHFGLEPLEARQLAGVGRVRPSRLLGES